MKTPYIKPLNIVTFRGGYAQIYFHGLGEATNRGMVEGWSREPIDKRSPEQNKTGMADAGGGHDAPVRGDQGDAEAPSMERKDNEGLRVWLGITPRRVRIDPLKKRADYIKRLERLMRECDMVISDPQGYEGIQVKAMAILIRAIQVCYVLITDEAKVYPN